MLNHTLHPPTYTAVNPTEGASVTSGFNPSYQRTLPPVFRMPDNASNNNEKGPNKEKTEKKKNHIRKLPEDIPEIFQLITNTDYLDLSDFLLTPDHSKIIRLRNMLRMKWGVSEQTLYRPNKIETIKLDQTRYKVYHTTFHFIHNSQGLQYHVVI